MQVRVKNVGAAPPPAAGGAPGAAIDPRHEEASSMFGGIGNESNATCWAGEAVHRLLPNSDPPQEHQGPLHYFGIDQQYFLSALFPVGGAKEGRCVLTATASARITDTFFPLSLAPGETTLFSFGGFFGPKDFDLLAATTGAAVASQGATVSPGLEKSVDFGWWAVICKLLLTVMKWFHGLFGNWGVSIILLTVVVKSSSSPHPQGDGERGVDEEAPAQDGGD